MIFACAQVPAKAIDNDTEAILDNFFSSILDPSVELVSHAPEGINGVVRVTLPQKRKERPCPSEACSSVYLLPSTALISHTPAAALATCRLQLYLCLASDCL